MNVIYLDNNATTKVAPEVLDATHRACTRLAAMWLHILSKPVKTSPT